MRISWMRFESLWDPVATLGVHQPAMSRMRQRALQGVCMHAMRLHTPLW